MLSANYIKFTWLSVFLLSFLVSCEDVTQDTPNAQNNEVIRYLKANGFSELKTKGARSASNPTNKSIATMEEAKELVKLLRQLEGKSVDLSTDFDKKKGSNGRIAFVACEDAGTYYIHNVIHGLPGFGGIDVRFERDQFGHLTNISSYGLGFAPSWTQVGVSVFDPNSRFCIDATMLFGIDVEGFPLGYTAGVSVAVRLYGNACTATVTTSYGHC